MCFLLPQTNIGTLVVSIVAIVGLMIAKELNALLNKKIPVPIPVELVAVSTQEHLKHTRTQKENTRMYLLFSFQIIIATIISWQVNLDVKYGVEVVGRIPSG